MINTLNLRLWVFFSTDFDFFHSFSHRTRESLTCHIWKKMKKKLRKSLIFCKAVDYHFPPSDGCKDVFFWLIGMFLIDFDTESVDFGWLFNLWSWKSWSWVKIYPLSAELEGVSWFSWFSWFIAKKSYYVYSHPSSLTQICFLICLTAFLLCFGWVWWFFMGFRWSLAGLAGKGVQTIRQQQRGVQTIRQHKSTQKCSKSKIFDHFFFDQNVFKHVF